MENLFDKFKLGSEKEELSEVIGFIDNGVVFRGTNLWILIFAIFVASLGLNLNSPAVIIGAMLISPLMGPIMGIGLGIGINDVTLLRKAIYNYLIAGMVALTTSTLFFLISPLNEAHSEILSRTSPTVYDVLIAFFGGCAGILATSSRQKGNVLPGVAIATALMPPLCAAGYGLATFRFNIFLGAFYLFIINSVFIAWATFIVVRVLHFPYHHFQNKRADNIARVVVALVVLVTLIPSIYFGYDIVQRDRFVSSANRFIDNEARFQNDYLLNRKVDGRTRTITLVFGGQEISPGAIDSLKAKLKMYNLEEAKLEINQGFAYMTQDDAQQTAEATELTQAIATQDVRLQGLQKIADSVANNEKLQQQVFRELQSQYPSVRSGVLQYGRILPDSSHAGQVLLVVLDVRGYLGASDRSKIEKWMGVRLHEDNVHVIVDKLTKQK